MRFNKGDRVQAIKNDGRIEVGYIGTVVFDNGGEGCVVGCDWDELTDSHDCDGRTRKGHGYWVFRETLKLVQEKIEIKNEDIEKIPKPYRYIARDKDGNLFAYIDKPYRDVGGKQWYGNSFRSIDKNLFSEIKWGDEPFEIK